MNSTINIGFHGGGLLEKFCLWCVFERLMILFRNVAPLRKWTLQKFHINCVCTRSVRRCCLPVFEFKQQLQFSRSRVPSRLSYCFAWNQTFNSIFVWQCSIWLDSNNPVSIWNMTFQVLFKKEKVYTSGNWIKSKCNISGDWPRKFPVFMIISNSNLEKRAFSKDTWCCRKDVRASEM